jgi:RND family efflux transporter MFP subunit
VNALLGLTWTNAAWATVVALVAAVGAGLLRRRPAVIHTLWLLVLLKLVSPSLVYLRLPWDWNRNETMLAQSSPSLPLSPITAAKRDPSLREHHARPHIEPGPGARAFLSDQRLAQAAQEGSRASAMQHQSQFAPMTVWPWKSIVVGAWLAGASVWWVTVARSSQRFRQLLGSVKPAPADLEERADHVAAQLALARVPAMGMVAARIPPMLWAALWGRPRLLLPEALWAELDDAQKDAVLAHELAHLRRRDHWVRRLETIVLGLYWWFPVAWWSRRQLMQAEEECCDAWVLWAQPASAGAYAEALVATAAFVSGVRVPLPPGASGAGNAMPIKRRLNMLCDETVRTSRAGAVPRVLLVLGVGLLPLLPAMTLGQSKSTAPANESKTASGAQKRTEHARPTEQPTDQKPLQPDAVARPGNSGERPLKARICQAIEREVRDSEDHPGVIESVQWAQLRARVTGYLVSVETHPGQIVQKGATLFQIDPRSFQMELEKAEAEVRRSQSRLKPLSAQLDQAGALSKVSHLKIEVELEEAEAALQAAKAARELSRLNLAYTTVTAPFTGKISGPLVVAGNVAVADKTVLGTLTKIDPLFVEFNVSGATFFRMSRLKHEGKLKSGFEPGVIVHVSVEGDPDLVLNAKIDSIDTQIDPGSHGVRCRALISNAEGLLLPGLSATVHVKTNEPRRAVLVPVTSVVRPGEWNLGQYSAVSTVIVVTEQNEFQLRSVKLGRAYDGAYEIIEDLKAGEWIVIAPHPVEPFRPASPEAVDPEVPKAPVAAQPKLYRPEPPARPAVDFERVPWPDSKPITNY